MGFRVGVTFGQCMAMSFSVTMDICSKSCNDGSGNKLQYLSWSVIAITLSAMKTVDFFSKNPKKGTNFRYEHCFRQCIKRTVCGKK